MWWQQHASPTKLHYLQQYAIGKTALDLGTGAGHYAQALSAQNFKVVGLDLQHHAAHPFPTVQGRLNAIPLTGTFDTVLAFDILEHEADEANALREMRRLTGKRLILSVPNADDSLLTPYNLTFKHHIDKTHQREYSTETLRHKLTQAGFHVLTIKKEGAVHPALLAEFVRPRLLRRFAWLGLKGLFKLKILQSAELMADLYAVAEVK
jgi:2-polyprenyl-3-methyl-5-hydroxy-6-metoxy-1,4-benzoquinol methylase